MVSRGCRRVRPGFDQGPAAIETSNGCQREASYGQELFHLSRSAIPPAPEQEVVQIGAGEPALWWIARFRQQGLEDPKPAVLACHAAARGQDLARCVGVPVEQHPAQQVEVAARRHMGTRVAGNESRTLGNPGAGQRCGGVGHDPWQVEQDAAQVPMAPQEGSEKSPGAASHVDHSLGGFEGWLLGQ